MAVDNYYYIPTTVLKIQFIRYKEWTNSRRQPMLRSSVVQLHKEGARLDLGPRAPTRPPSCSSSSLSSSSLQSFRRWKCFVSMWRQIWGLNSCQSLVFEYAELLCCFFQIWLPVNTSYRGIQFRFLFAEKSFPQWPLLSREISSETAHLQLTNLTNQFPNWQGQFGTLVLSIDRRHDKNDRSVNMVNG